MSKNKKNSLEDYNSEDDEDFVLEESEDEDVKKEKRLLANISMRAGGTGTKRKSKAKSRIGGDVLSDDEDFSSNQQLKRVKILGNNPNKSPEKKVETPVSYTIDHGFSNFDSIFNNVTTSTDSNSNSSSKHIPSSNNLEDLLARSEGREVDQKVSSVLSVSEPLSMDDILNMAVKKEKKKKSIKKLHEFDTFGDIFSGTGGFDINTIVNQVENSINQKKETKSIFDKINESSNIETTDISKYIVNEEVDYAGEKVMVQRVLQKGSADEAAFLRRQKARGGNDNLDSLVATLKGKKDMSTLDKTRIDWTIDKEIEGDADELDKERKDGFLSKTEFIKQTELAAYERKLEDIQAARSKDPMFQ